MRQELQLRTLRETKGDFFLPASTSFHKLVCTISQTKTREFKDFILDSNSRKESWSSLPFAIIRQRATNTASIKHQVSSLLSLLEQILLFLQGDDRTCEQIQVNSSMLLFQTSSYEAEDKPHHLSEHPTGEQQNQHLSELQKALFSIRISIFMSTDFL